MRNELLSFLENAKRRIFCISQQRGEEISLAIDRWMISHLEYPLLSDFRALLPAITFRGEKMKCKFIETLRSLQKNSAESVDYLGGFGQQSSYLHVDRAIQRDLICLLKSVVASEEKSLVLLCGSAGDGKSHMLSYLKHSEYGKLLDSFVIRNDATESDAPERTAPETLAEALKPFDDENLTDGGHERVIVAINLGLLSRFLDSESGGVFSLLREYIDEVGVLKTGLSNQENASSSYFHVIDFSDYQIFEIENGLVNTDFVDTVLSKVFSASKENPFCWASVEACDACSFDKGICPVRHNYAFLSSKTVQASVSKLLIELALREQCVMTTRSILDYIFDIIVAPDFDIGSLSGYFADNPVKFAAEYLRMTTPQLIYSGTASSQLASKSRCLDPMIEDQEQLDELAIRFQISSKFLDELLPVIEETPYFGVFKNCSGFSSASLKNSDGGSGDLKAAIFAFIIRCSYLTGRSEDACEGLARTEYVEEFVKLLYSFNVGMESDLKRLKRVLLAKAIENWDGDYPNGCSLVKTYGDIQVLQKTKPVFGASCVQTIKNGTLSRFRPYLQIRVSLIDKKQGPFSIFQVDYNLYLLLKKMEKGYQPTLMDKHRFSDFQNSYEQLLGQGDKGTRIYLVRRSKSKKPFLEMSFDEDEEFDVEEL